MGAIHTDSRVNCDRCKASMAKGIRGAGHPAKPDMGHMMYFTNTGRIALCALR